MLNVKYEEEKKYYLRLVLPVTFEFGIPIKKNDYFITLFLLFDV